MKKYFLIAGLFLFGMHTFAQTGLKRGDFAPELLAETITTSPLI